MPTATTRPPQSQAGRPRPEVRWTQWRTAYGTRDYGRHGMEFDDYARILPLASRFRPARRQEVCRVEPALADEWLAVQGGAG